MQPSVSPNRCSWFYVDVTQAVILRTAKQLNKEHWRVLSYCWHGDVAIFRCKSAGSLVLWGGASRTSTTTAISRPASSSWKNISITGLLGGTRHATTEADCFWRAVVCCDVPYGALWGVTGCIPFLEKYLYQRPTINKKCVMEQLAIYRWIVLRVCTEYVRYGKPLGGMG